MINFREVNDDILKEWFEIRDDVLFSNLSEEDEKHFTCFDELSEKILQSVPKQNRQFIQKQLDLIDKSYMDYFFYWNEKYYRNGFIDGVQLIGGCFDK